MIAIFLHALLASRRESSRLGFVGAALAAKELACTTDIAGKAAPTKFGGRLVALLLGLLALPALAAFTDNGDGTVTDTVTGLMWDKCSWGQSSTTDCSGGSASTHAWSAALGVAVTANTASHRGYTDWRLPNRTELESLVKIGAISPAIDTTAFPNTPLAWFWSATTYAPNSILAWVVLFGSGDLYTYYKVMDSYVRLVRSGQSLASFDSMGEPPPPTAVYITGPNQTLSPTGSLPVELASGIDASGTTINLPADKSVTLKLGNLTVVVSAQGASARLVLRRMTVNGQSVTVATVASGTVQVLAQGTGQPLLAVGDTAVQAGAADARLTAARDGDALVLTVSQGFVVLPGASLVRQGKSHRTASAEFSIYAGERAMLDADGRVSRLMLGTDAGGAAGDPLSLELPDSLSIAAPVPNLAASAMRLGGPVQTAIAEAVGGTLAAGQSGGIVGIDLDGQRLYLLPLGEVGIDPEREDGVKLGADGTVTVSVSGIGVRFAPNFASLARFAADLAQALPGVSLAVREDGVIAAIWKGATYVVRIDWIAAPATAQAEGLAGDGQGRLNYVAGGLRYVLHPAFADFGRLAAAVADALPGATATTNPDGTVTVSQGGTILTLIPAYTLEAVPAGTAAWWVDAAGRLWLRNGDGSMQQLRVE